MNGFNSLKHVQQLDAHHSKLKKAQGERKKKFSLGQKNRSGQKKKKKKKRTQKAKETKEGKKKRQKAKETKKGKRISLENGKTNGTR